jgi:hypothetical protein
MHCWSMCSLMVLRVSMVWVKSGVQLTVWSEVLMVWVNVEGFSRPLAKEKDLLKHINSGLVDPGLEGNSILLQVIVAVVVLVLISDGQFVRVLTPVTPSLSTCLEGLKLSTRHQHFPPGLGARSIGISSSPLPQIGIPCHCEGQVQSSRTM